MTGAEVQASWFTPFHFFAYLFIIFVLMIAYYQWQWASKCNKFVKVIICKADGSSDTTYMPKEGSSISITNPTTGATKLWPITDVATIEMLYPGDGFIPVFLQKKIRTTIVDDLDWEPRLNRGAYSMNVASPDVKLSLSVLAESLPEGATRARITSLAENLKTAPTREMIASPAILGNIAKEKVSELAVTVAKDIMNPLQEAIKKLRQQVNPTVVYIGLSLIVVLLVYVVIRLQTGASTDMEQIARDIDLIKQSLGIRVQP